MSTLNHAAAEPSAEASATVGLLPPAVIRNRCLPIAAIGVAALVTMCLLPPIHQDPAFHAFADRRSHAGIANFGDVVSNAAFLVVGVLGLVALARPRNRTFFAAFAEPRERWLYLTLFITEVLTAIGSTYYHLAPDNGHLFWDRLPLTAMFATICAITIAERIDLRAGQRALLPLIAVCGATVVYWHLGDLRGAGDLRFYGLVQFYPMLAIPLLLVLLPSRYSHGHWWWLLLAGYTAAKLCEVYDRELLSLFGCLSGHTIKHLIAAAATAALLPMLRLRSLAIPSEKSAISPPRENGFHQPRL